MATRKQPAQEPKEKADSAPSASGIKPEKVIPGDTVMITLAPHALKEAPAAAFNVEAEVVAVKNGVIRAEIKHNEHTSKQHVSTVQKDVPHKDFAGEDHAGATWC